MFSHERPPGDSTDLVLPPGPLLLPIMTFEVDLTLTLSTTAFLLLSVAVAGWCLTRAVEYEAPLFTLPFDVSTLFEAEAAPLLGKVWHCGQIQNFQALFIFLLNVGRDEKQYKY